MPMRRRQPVVWAPTGLTDAPDAGHAFQGSMAVLKNMMWAPPERDVWVHRPASIEKTNFPGFISPAEVTELITVGNTAYGFVTSQRFPGRDEPFAYDMETEVFLPIANLKSANLPATQAPTGDWTPPTAEPVGTRIVFTHPGFPGGTSGTPFSSRVTGNIISGQPTITGDPGRYIGFETIVPGMSVQGGGIPDGTTIESVNRVVFDTTGTGSIGNSFITVADASGVRPGMKVFGTAANGAYVTTVIGTTVNIETPNVVNLSADPVSFQGTTVLMSANATSTIDQASLIFTSSMAINYGWLDLSSFELEIVAAIIAGDKVLRGNPSLEGIQPGLAITGTGIPAGTVVESSGTLTLTAAASTVLGSPQLIFVEPVSVGFADGATVTGPGIPPGTILLSDGIPIGDQLATMSVAATATTGSTPVDITLDGAFIIMSEEATATNPNAILTVAGGSIDAPLWGAGDTAPNSLEGVPVFARQFYGRAYYGVNTETTAGVVASDSLLSGVVTNATQIILFEDRVPVTAAVGMPLSTQLGGIIQSLMVFQGAARVHQITGDFALETWVRNALPVSTGTFAPRSVVSTPHGVIFMAPDGLRLINFDAAISDPLGGFGRGIVLPFLRAQHPSRVIAAFGGNIYRISLNNGVKPGAPREEYWLNLDLGKWCGPHTFPFDVIAPWQAEQTFIGQATGVPGKLFTSKTIPTGSPVVIENGQQMTFEMTTPLMPDSPLGYASSLVECSVFFQMSNDNAMLAVATDDQGREMAKVYVWLGPDVFLAQTKIPWNRPMNFRQMRLSFAGDCDVPLTVGTMTLGFARLGYQLNRPIPLGQILGRSVGGAARP